VDEEVSFAGFRTSMTDLVRFIHIWVRPEIENGGAFITKRPALSRRP